MSKRKTPIACDLHDYVEIACMYGYRIQVLCLYEISVEGRALTTRTLTRQTLNTRRAAEKIEYLVIDAGGHTAEVALHEIITITAITQNPYFSVLNCR